MTTLPRLLIPRVAANWAAGADPFAWAWEQAVTLPPMVLADGSGPAQQQTTIRVCYNEQDLFIRFDCADTDIWGTYSERDAAIYDEEVVEVFLAPGTETPVDYYEFEVSPNGVLLEVLAHNPTGERGDIRLDFSWDCAGLRWGAQREDAQNQWRAFYAMPWASVGASVGVSGSLPPVWRINFYRIERPRTAEPEFSCWSPTMSNPANFHRPAYFGYLALG
ncbi:MAG: carbohydrate-binding family 9-like protein [Caldilineaceae bacterium]|nr:carbohydrate-binding family 9-like protein [Caldilineaceae bacterium]